MNINPRKRKETHRGKDKYYQSKEWKRLRGDIKKRDKGICQGCLKSSGVVHIAGKYATVDHIIPRKTKMLSLAKQPEWMDEYDFFMLKQKIFESGYDIPENLMLVCKQYHDKKSAKEKIK